MTIDSGAAVPEKQKLPWGAIWKFMIVAVLTVAFLLLGMSMVHHRFFRGGSVDQHGVLKP